MKTINNGQAVLLVFGAVVLAVVIFMADVRIMGQPQPAAEAPPPQAAPTEVTADLEAVARNAQTNLSEAGNLTDQLAKLRSQLPSFSEFAAKEGAPTMNGSEFPPTPEPIDTAGYQAPVDTLTVDIPTGGPQLSGWERIAATGFEEIVQKVEFREAIHRGDLTFIDDKGMQWVFGPAGWFMCAQIGVNNGTYYYLDPDPNGNAADWWAAQQPATIERLVSVCHGGQPQ
jgi:hypothetical protein